jgi:hypothetical protein
LSRKGGGRKNRGTYFIKKRTINNIKNIITIFHGEIFVKKYRVKGINAINASAPAFDRKAKKKKNIPTKRL